MGEIITFHVGQAGIGIGEAFWSELAADHNLKPSSDGGLTEAIQGQEVARPLSSYPNSKSNTNLRSFFQQSQKGNLVPRSIFVDLDKHSIKQVKTGRLKGVFSETDGFVAGNNQDASNIYSRGHYTVGKECIDQVEKQAQRLAEKCDSLQGIVMTHSICGGTGSGLGSLISERLSILFGKKTKCTYTLIPDLSPQESNLAAYNCTLALHGLLEHSDLTVILQNASIQDNLYYNLDIEQVTMKTVDAMISHHMSNIFSGIRHEATGLKSMSELVANVVPYPRIHFPTATYSPWIPKSSSNLVGPDIYDVTYNIFEPTNCLSSVPILKHRMMNSVLLYRGQVADSEVNSAAGLLHQQKWNIVPVEWSPNPVKVARTSGGMNSAFADLHLNKLSLSALANSIGCMAPLEKVANQFDIVYAKRAFVHWYVGEGMSEGEMSESREDLAALCKDCEDWGWNGIEPIEHHGEEEHFEE